MAGICLYSPRIARGRDQGLRNSGDAWPGRGFVLTTWNRFVFAGIPIRRIPWTLVLCVVALVALGLGGIRRADYFNEGPDLFSKQVTWILFALPALTASLCIPYRYWKPVSYLMFGVSLPLLIVVLFMARRGGARCWIPLGFFDLQPSEIVKLTFIMALAQYLMYRENHRRLAGLIAPFLITAVPLVLILIEPDLGSAMLFVPVLFAMLFAAGARPWHLACVVLLGAALSPLFWTKMSAEQKSRVVALFTQVDGGPNPNGDRWHQHQSKLVISLGGAWGSESTGRVLDDDAYRLFAAQTDFVFCMVAERWGLAGGILTLGIYLVLFGKGLMIAGATREPFGRLVAVGIVALLATQTVINTAMTVGLLPVVGITLPLMSYGGSSLLMTAVALGLLMNVGMNPGYEMTPDPFRFE
jgi:cell division protein FtsW (lipid II flippase)